jgi:hypothetical protein
MHCFSQWRYAGVVQSGLAAILTGAVIAWSTALVITQPFKLISSATKMRFPKNFNPKIFIGAFILLPPQGAQIKPRQNEKTAKKAESNYQPHRIPPAQD